MAKTSKSESDSKAENLIQVKIKKRIWATENLRVTAFILINLMCKIGAT